MKKNIMSFEEFINFLETDSLEIEKFRMEFKSLLEKKEILTFEEWSNQNNRRLLFLTYDLVNVNAAPNNIYNTINNFLACNSLGFSRDFKGRPLTNNSFVSFLSNGTRQNSLNTVSNTLVNFFSNYLPDFRIYLNVTNENEIFLHP